MDFEEPAQTDPAGDELTEVAILGAAGGGAEVLVYLRDMIENGANVKPYGFIDDNPSLEGQSFLDLPVLGNVEWAFENLPKNVALVSSIGNTRKKESVIQRFADAGFSFFAVVHSSALIGPEVTIGTGAVVSPGVILTTKITVGEHAFLNIGTHVSHDTTIGPFCTINQGVRIAGSVRLGRGVYLGASTTILHSMEIGDFAVIGASALVNRPIPPRVNAIGIPARVVYSRDGRRDQGRPQRPYHDRDRGGYGRDRDRGGYNRDRDRGGYGRDRGRDYRPRDNRDRDHRDHPR